NSDRRLGLLAEPPGEEVPLAAARLAEFDPPAGDLADGRNPVSVTDSAGLGLDAADDRQARAALGAKGNPLGAGLAEVDGPAGCGIGLVAGTAEDGQPGEQGEETGDSGGDDCAAADGRESIGWHQFS